MILADALRVHRSLASGAALTARIMTVTSRKLVAGLPIPGMSGYWRLAHRRFSEP